MQQDEAGTPAPTPTRQEVDPARVQAFLQHRRKHQNLPAAILAGLLAAIVGAFVWGFIAKTTEREIGWIAVGIGFLVGFAVQKFGKGVDVQFNVIGAAFAFIGVAFGKVLAVCMLAAKMTDTSTMDFLGKVDFAFVKSVFTETFSPIDLLFYGLALWAGWQYASRRLTEEEARSLVTDA